MRYKYDIKSGFKKLRSKTAISAYVLSLGIAGLGSSLAFIPALSHAASGGNQASYWHIGYYNPSGRALSESQAQSAPDGVASLNFTNQPNTALLTTDQKAKNPTLLGDLTGKKITLNFTISNAGTFNYYGEGTPSNPCGTPANTRLYFTTSNAGGFDYTHYWWSNPASFVLNNGSGSVTATVEPAEWSDWNGQSGTVVPDGFATAASNVTEFGLSFGGGCFFENGVGTTDGSGVFTLNSYTVI